MNALADTTATPGSLLPPGSGVIGSQQLQPGAGGRMDSVTRRVLREFAGLHHQLTEVAGVKVSLFEHGPDHGTPDAVFPNNVRRMRAASVCVCAFVCMQCASPSSYSPKVSHMQQNACSGFQRTHRARAASPARSCFIP